MKEAIVNEETRIKSIYDCDSLRSGKCKNCAKRGIVTEMSVGDGLETKQLCKNCGSEQGVY